MAAQMMSRGQLAIHTLTLDDRLIAAQLWLRKNDIAYGLKTGYDPALGQYSPGQVLLLQALQDLCEDPEVKLADLGIAGPGSFKERWGDEPLQLFELCIFGKSTRARILYHRMRLREAVRQNRLVRFARAKWAARRRPSGPRRNESS
jgi:CelD/BcsL family acetyltransferase involved in cellulose biosynthesis